MRKIAAKKGNQLNICVIIPTYNNEKTIGRVIRDVLSKTKDVIVVNDGSTDSTRKILRGFKGLDAIQYVRNRGKGHALRTAFSYAFEKGYTHAITMDSDGQHLPSDIPVMTRAAKKNPDAIIIGARNMDQKGIPRKSSFGNKFSNFWFRFETGIDLPDTQSGFRVYPLASTAMKLYFSDRFEFEIEVIVRAAWSGVRVISEPIRVVYQSDDDRVTHFRPITDFSRISVLNTIFVTWTIMFVKPRDFFRSHAPSNIKKKFIDNVIESGEKDRVIILSVMLGLFMGIVPVWGYQTLVALTLAVFFRLNKIITFVASNISIPPCIPFIIYGSYRLGGFLLPDTHVKRIDLSTIHSLSAIKENLIQYILGSIALAAVVALIGGILTLAVMRLMRGKKKRRTKSSMVKSYGKA